MWKFEKLVDFQHSSSVPLKNLARELMELQPSDWVQQDGGRICISSIGLPNFNVLIKSKKKKLVLLKNLYCFMTLFT